MGGLDRGRWPVHRTVCWYTGLACAGVGMMGPIAQAAHTSFAAHMAAHLLMAMLAPLLLVLVLAGYLFTASIVGVDPAPHRASIRLRAAALIAFIAAHSILATWLYAHPPQGVDAADGRAGAQLMYYGGDAVDVTIIVLLLAGWYTARRPGRASVASMPVARMGTEPTPTP